MFSLQAYFLPSDSPAAVLEWVRQHPDYTASQVMGLVTALMEGSKSTSLYLLKGNSSATKELLSQVFRVTHFEPSTKCPKCIEPIRILYLIDDSWLSVFYLQVQTAVQNNEPLSRRLSLSELAAWERGEIEVT
jgi:hypothetical protein